MFIDQLTDNQRSYIQDTYKVLLKELNHELRNGRGIGFSAAEICRLYLPFDPDDQYGCMLHLIKMGVLYCDPVTKTLYPKATLLYYFSDDQLDHFWNNDMGVDWTAEDEAAYNQWLLRPQNRLL